MNHPNHHHAPQFAPDFLIDGYIAYTFKPQNAEGYLVHLFNVNAASVHHQSGAFYALNHPVHNIPPAHFVNGQDAWLLDYVVRAGGSVVPQEPWSPQGQGDRRRYVIQAQFRMPVFFVDSDGNLGVPVMNAAAGLHGAGLPPQLVDKTSIKIHIGVCTRSFLCVPYHLPCVSQWPGYATSEHQVQLKDQKPEKNPFTFDRFVKHVGSRVQTFLGVRLS
jgi:hypothetical protein